MEKNKKESFTKIEERTKLQRKLTSVRKNRKSKDNHIAQVNIIGRLQKTL